jgi:hypothetical protein
MRASSRNVVALELDRIEPLKSPGDYRHCHPPTTPLPTSLRHLDPIEVLLIDVAVSFLLLAVLQDADGAEQQ